MYVYNYLRFLPVYACMSRSDPYVTMQVGNKKEKQKKRQTKVVKKTLNPQWHEKFEVFLNSQEVASEFVTVQVWDKDFIGVCIEI